MRFVLHMRLAQAIEAYQRHARALGLPAIEIDRGLSTRTKGGTWSLSDGYMTVAQVRADGTVLVSERRRLRRD